MYPVIETQMKKTLNNLKHCWQQDFIEEKASSKVSYPSFFSIAMNLVILIQDAHRRTTKKETSTKIEEKMMEETTETKARSHATLLMNMTLMKMMMKWYML